MTRPITRDAHGVSPMGYWTCARCGSVLLPLPWWRRLWRWMGDRLTRGVGPMNDSTPPVARWTIERLRPYSDGQYGGRWWVRLSTPAWHQGRGPHISIGLGAWILRRDY